MKRSAGILLPIFSLPSNYGIGTFGKSAYEFVDFLDNAGQTYWQILPLGQTAFGNSPYQSYSSIAGNPYFVDLDLLKEDKLLNENDLKDLKDDDKVDYQYLEKTRFNILYKAYKNGINKYQDEFNEFVKNNDWLNDYALFMSLKKYFNNDTWINWPNKIKTREEKEIEKYESLLKDDICFYSFIQFLFFKQYKNLKEYANNKGIKIIGDIPIYLPLDSVEVWSTPLNFKLDKNYLPKEVSGVPPDYFSSTGQLWGNPIYNYKYQAKSNYAWWVNRINALTSIYDVIRIDHFRGIEAYWSIPYGEKTAINGKWVKGPGLKLINILKKECNIEFIAEDLGYHTPSLDKMLKASKLPGMRVLEFGFDSNEFNDNLPHNYVENSVCYLGTHDNDTVMGFYENINRDTLNTAIKYINHSKDDEFNWSMIKCGMMSISNLFIVQIQDYLGLDTSNRINTPGTIGNNWMYRLKKNELNNDLAYKIRCMTYLYRRGK